MLGVGLGLHPQPPAEVTVPLPVGLGWDSEAHPIQVLRGRGGFRSETVPRDLVDPGIWSGAAIHVDAVSGNDANSGQGAADGDFSDAKKTIWAAFVAGNATGAPYRVIVKPGLYQEAAFTRNGQDEPSQPVAVVGWGGAVRFRTGPWQVVWSDQAGTFGTQESAVVRVFRTDVLTPRGHYSELSEVADPAACAATVDSWCADGGEVHVNIGSAPGTGDIALIRAFHGARFLSHAADLYLENIHCEGGITGALHCDAVATRNVVAVGCSFRYSAPTSPAAAQDAARVRRTSGLVACFDCDASFGAKDGWNFHEDGASGLHVLLEDCSGSDNGAFGVTSCNALTSHDAVRMIVLGGDFGNSRNGTEVHCIQQTASYLAGCRVVARDVDGSSVAYQCSFEASMWLDEAVADAAGGASNHAIEANSGTVFTRGFQAVAGDIVTSGGGSVSAF
ncbi:hypothetical protein [Marinovum sp.]|uniref:hypothetical protein n=1 Tax=Marinovum sp. TaxID=2024839 RepID=UPI002B273719|nr:hypothetical protein [Marinovum sp.]